MVNNTAQARKSFWKTFETRNERRETNLTLKQYTGVPAFHDDETEPERYSEPQIKFPQEVDLSTYQSDFPLANLGESLKQGGIQ